MDGLFSMTAIQLATALRSGQIGVAELTKAYLERIERYDGPDGLNAVAELDERALDQARKMDYARSGDREALFGLPVLVKDNIDVAGLHTTAGSLALEDNTAERDAPVIANLRRRGAIILGKTNMTEFANYTGEDMPGGYSSRSGTVRNAYDRSKNPGGSSSGSAVAVSAGFCAAAVGTDTSFSIVGCATENGVTGLKPAHGSLPQNGIIPISHTLDSAGPLTRDAADAVLVYSYMRDDPMPPVEPVKPDCLRLAVNIFDRDQVSDAQLARYETLFTALRGDGVNFAEVSHAYTPRLGDIMRCEFRNGLEEYLAGSNARRKTLDEIVRFYEADPERMMKYGDARLRAALDEAPGALRNEAYAEALAERGRLREQMLDCLRPYDACIMSGPTNIMHFTGLPSLALRMCMADDGTPRGVILYGADEFRLFAAARTIERYCTPVCPPDL